MNTDILHVKCDRTRVPSATAFRFLFQPNPHVLAQTSSSLCIKLTVIILTALPWQARLGVRLILFTSGQSPPQTQPTSQVRQNLAFPPWLHLRPKIWRRFDRLLNLPCLASVDPLRRGAGAAAQLKLLTLLIGLLLPPMTRSESAARDRLLVPLKVCVLPLSAVSN